MRSPTCKDCGSSLVLGENWTAGQEKARSYVCRSCASNRGKRHYRLHADRAAELQRLRLSSPEGAERSAAYKSAYYAKNRGRWKEYGLRHKELVRNSPWHRAGKLITWVRARAGAKGLAFDLSREWAEAKLQAGTCEVTVRAFDFGLHQGARFNPWGPSIDRIDSSKGYTQDNCRMVLWIYNMAKAEWVDSVVMEFAVLLARRV